MIKKVLSFTLSLATALSCIPAINVNAETDKEPFEYLMFALSDDDGAITISADNVCLNGNIGTNGTITTEVSDFFINGQCKEKAAEEKMFTFSREIETYFLPENDYVRHDVNIVLDAPVQTNGNIELDGNVKVQTHIIANNDISIEGDSLNATNAALIAENGNIDITASSVDLSGLIYVPNGIITINSANVNLNHAVILAEKIIIDCQYLNANYSVDVAELLSFVKENTDVHDEKNENTSFIAYGNYNPETKKLNISWDEQSDITDYQIEMSDINEERIILDTVSDVLYYEYKVADDFEYAEFTVSYTDNNNKLDSSPAIILRKNEDGVEAFYRDTDEDGLNDPLEILLGTDPRRIDTDDDSLSDYEEITLFNTDPTIFDSFKAGISDAEADMDNDSVSNAEELKIHTSPLEMDTDGDGLDDGKEIYDTLTDPLKADTDDDGLDDYFEVKNGLDPLSAYTDNIPDDQRQIEQYIPSDSEKMFAINTEDSPYSISLDIVTNGDAEKELSVHKSRLSMTMESDSQIGELIELSISDLCSPSGIRIYYDIKDDYTDNTLNKYVKYDEDLKGIKRLCVFRYCDPINMMLPVQTQYDIENNRIYADVDETGTYCVMDLEVWYDLFDIEPEKIMDDNTVPQTKKAPQTKNAAMRRQAPKVSYAPPEEQNTEKNVAPLDLVFILQTAGPSTAEEIYDSELSLMEDVTDYVFNTYSNVRVYVIDYKYDQAEIMKFGISDYCTNVTALSKGIRNLKFDIIGEADYCNTKLPFSLLMDELQLRNEVNSFIYHLHNGSNHYTTSLDGAYISRSDKGIFSQVTPLDYEFSVEWYGEYIDNAIKNNGGLNVSFDTDTTDIIIKHLSGMVDYTITRSEYDALLANNLKKVTLDGKLSPASNIDTDIDSLSDWNEVMTDYITLNSDGTVTLPTIGDLIEKNEAMSQAFLQDNSVGISNDSFRSRVIEELKAKTVLPCKTDPTLMDTDNDGYTDASDPEPLNGPAFLNGKNDFMNNESYYVTKIDSPESRLSFKSDGTVIMNNYSIGEDNSQILKFEWNESSWHDMCGYKLLNSENKALTVVPSGDSYTVEMQEYNHKSNQIWEIIPYSEKSASGFVLRSKYNGTENNKLGESLYLNYNDDTVTVDTKITEKSAFNVASIKDDWCRFGQLYMIEMGWIPYALGIEKDDLDRSFKNFYNNQRYHKEPDSDSDYYVSSKNGNLKLLVYQSGSFFKNMKYADAPMDDVICEVIATYNAICIDKGTNKAADFLRLVVEFENCGIRNVLKSNLEFTDSFSKDGGWGSWPGSIGNCLDCYQINYFDTTSKSECDERIKASDVKCGIVTGSFVPPDIPINAKVLDILGLEGLHTFAVEYDNANGRVIAYNYDTTYKKDDTKSASIAKLLEIDEYKFELGYVLY